MSENMLIYIIRQTPHLSKLFDQLSNEQKRRALEMAEGEVDLLDYILEDLSEENL